MKTELKEKVNAGIDKLFKGELTIKKADLWLIGAVCLLVGIVYGLRKAPWTHGVMIGSNNGSNNCDNNNNNHGSVSASACEEADEENV